METHSAVTRFCFICNYVSRIIEPLASRCAKFRFKPLHEGVMEDRVTAVATAEGVRLGDGAMDALGRVSNGDLRRALTTLQSAYALHDNPVMPSTIIDVAGEVRSSAPADHHVTLPCMRLPTCGFMPQWRMTQAACMTRSICAPLHRVRQRDYICRCNPPTTTCSRMPGPLCSNTSVLKNRHLVHHPKTMQHHGRPGASV